MTEPAPKQPSALLDLLLTVVAPSVVLDYLSAPEQLGPVGALAVSMLFPVAFGVWCWWKRHAWNAFSVIGFVTVLLSGGLGLLKLDAFWFSIKESALYLALGAAFPISDWCGKPLINALILQPQIFNLRAVQTALDTPEKQTAFAAALRRASWEFGLGIVVLSVGNFYFAKYLLDGKEPGGEAFVRAIGTLNWAGMVVIGVPTTILMILVFLGLVRRIQHITGLEKEDLMNPGRTVRRQVVHQPSDEG